MSRTKQPIRENIELGGRFLSYELFRGSYKNINLRIRNDGSVRVSANQRVSIRRIQAFLRDNEAFIVRTLAKLEAQSATMPKESPWRDGGVIPILGRERRIRVVLGDKNRATMMGDDLLVTVHVLSEDQIRHAALRMLAEESERLILELCQSVGKRFEIYRIPTPHYKFRYMVSQWGSCCPYKQTITFNQYLICVPVECMEYVIVHEMAHFLQLNHSSAFWSIVEEVMPDWRERKKRLIPYGIWLRKL